MSARVYARFEEYRALVEAASLMAVLDEVADRVKRALDDLSDWGPSGQRPGQYRSDLVADRAALDVLQAAGISVLSEESGRTDGNGGDSVRSGFGEADTSASGELAFGSTEASASAELVAVLDPVDGSTNAARGIPWFATSICVVDGDGPLAALVANQATGVRYRALREAPATRDHQPIAPRGTTELHHSVLGLTGYPPRYLGWRQYRALGAAALDLCAVADGTLDGYVDCGYGGHGVWDYLGGLLVCERAGALVVDAEARELLTLDYAERRSPVAGGTPQLCEALVTARHDAFSRSRHRHEAS